MHVRLVSRYRSLAKRHAMIFRVNHPPPLTLPYFRSGSLSFLLNLSSIFLSATPLPLWLRQFLWANRSLCHVKHPGTSPRRRGYRGPLLLGSLRLNVMRIWQGWETGVMRADCGECGL